MTPATASRFPLAANTGFLWTDLPFLDRIRQAARYGFDAVEFHDEARRTDRGELKAVLAETGLPVGGINLRMEETFGCAAIPGQEAQANRDIDEAIEIADDIDAAAIHILAGVTADPGAPAAYLRSLRHALDHTDRTILIEPVCAEQLPGYFMQTIEQAAGVLSEIGNPRLKIMFDCYHIFQESNDVLAAFRAHANDIGHVQIAAVERRAEPFPGAIDYATLLPAMRSCGYRGRFGCEYRPAAGTGEGLAWRKTLPPDTPGATNPGHRR